MDISLQSTPQMQSLVQKLVDIAREAGNAILEIRNAGICMEEKRDGSPVTLADKEAERIVLSGLKRCAPGIPVVSEENENSHTLSAPAAFFLVDPLDGTREFIRPHGDDQGAFTVNIALVDKGTPLLGVVFAPARNAMFCGLVGTGAHANGQPIQARVKPVGERVALTSRSHGDEQTRAWLASNNVSRTVCIGSSLKFCLLAQGDGDVYPRFGPTMEWDTAAGQAILTAAGGRVENPDGTPFIYGKPGYRNGSFFAFGAAH